MTSSQQTNHDPVPAMKNSVIIEFHGCLHCINTHIYTCIYMRVYKIIPRRGRFRVAQMSRAT